MLPLLLGASEGVVLGVEAPAVLLEGVPLVEVPVPLPELDPPAESAHAREGKDKAMRRARGDLMLMSFIHGKDRF